MPRLARFPLTSEHKAAISATKTGTTLPEETKERIAKALRGVKRSPETLARMKAAQQARRAHEKDDRAVVEEGRKAAAARHKANAEVRSDQQLEDIHTAVRIGRMDLALDIQQSKGWKANRKIFDSRVSDGLPTPVVAGRVSRREKKRQARAILWG